MEISIRALGLEEWVRKINALKDIEKNPNVNKALGRGAARVQGAVKLLTPVDTGNLRNKISPGNKSLLFISA